MLSPNDIKPKGYTPSIWSLDSGYGSNIVDDEESRRQQSASTGVTATRHPAPIGLGIALHQPTSTTTRSTNYRQSPHIQNKFQPRLQQSPVEPVTTRLHVFPAKSLEATSVHGVNANCIACQLWTFTNPGDGTRCPDCRHTNSVGPRASLPQERSIKCVVPRLEIPKEPHSFVNYSPGRSRCSACRAARRSGTSTCASCSPNPSSLSPISPDTPSTVRRSCARRPAKLPPHAVRQLRAWLKDNQSDPYPTPETKHMLAATCGISEKQVTTWFTNTRARKLALPCDRSYGSSDEDGHYDESDLSSANATPVCPSTSTLANGFAPGSLAPTAIALTSFEPTTTPQPVSRRGKKKDYRRINNLSPADDSPIASLITSSPTRDGAEQEMWQCTFCLQSLVPKSWRRHEETQHLPKHQWICLASHPRIPMTTRNGIEYSVCAFCNVKNPDDNHFFTQHRIFECRQKNEADRTFGRPDHLRQHIKNFHKCSPLDVVRDRWRRDSPGKKRNEPWTCGFCAVELRDWDARETHIANHFKEGKTMAQWTGQTVTANTERRRSSVLPKGMMPKLKGTFKSRRSSQQEDEVQAQGPSMTRSYNEHGTFYSQGESSRTMAATARQSGSANFTSNVQKAELPMNSTISEDRLSEQQNCKNLLAYLDSSSSGGFFEISNMVSPRKQAKMPIVHERYTAELTQQPQPNLQYNTIRHDTPYYQPDVTQFSVPTDIAGQTFTSNAYLNPVISPPSLPQLLDWTFNPSISTDFLNYNFSSRSDATPMAMPTATHNQQYSDMFLNTSPVTTTAQQQQQLGNMFTSPIDMYNPAYGNPAISGMDYSAFANIGVYDGTPNASSSADASASANDGSGLEYQVQWH